MKIYDKDMYKTQQKIFTATILTVMFLIGFAVGYITKSIDQQKRINELELELDNYKQEYYSNEV